MTKMKKNNGLTLHFFVTSTLSCSTLDLCEVS